MLEFSSSLAALSSGEQRLTPVFARQLGTVFGNPELLLSAAVDALAAAPRGNPAFVGGLILALDQRDPALVSAALDRCAMEEALRPHLTYLTCQRRISAEDLNRIIVEVNIGRLPVSSLLTLQYGKALDHLDPTEIQPLIETMLQHQHGAQIALELFGMYTLGRPDRTMTARELAFHILNCLDPLSEEVDVMASHHLGSLVRVLLNDEDLGPKIAEQVARWTVAACERNAAHRTRENIAPLTALALRRYPNVTWPIIKNAIVAANPVSRYLLESFLGNRYRNKETPGMLFLLPVDMLLAWCREAPKSALLLSPVSLNRC